MATIADAARSPSPVPAAPLQQTPGPRATALADLYTKAFAATLRSCSYENFAACFPTPAERAPRVLRAVWEQICGKIEAKGQAEFEQICTERGVIDRLNALEALVTDAKSRKAAAGPSSKDDSKVPPHQLVPDDLLAAHLAPQLAPIKKLLETRLDTTQKRNQELLDLIRIQQEQIEKIVGGLEAAVKDLEGANQVLEDAVQGKSEGEMPLRSEIWELRRELASSEQ